MKYVKTDVVRDTEDAELMDEIRRRIETINQYLQNPDHDTLVPLLGDDLQERYGEDRVRRMAHGALCAANDIVEEASVRFTGFFDRFNELYFGRQLPHYDVVVRLRIRYYGKTIWRSARVIELLAGSEPRMVTRLLDEMAHIATTDDCGDAWREEIGRLSLDGAPIEVYPDLEELLADDFILAATSIPMTAPAFCRPSNFGVQA